MSACLHGQSHRDRIYRAILLAVDDPAIMTVMEERGELYSCLRALVSRIADSGDRSFDDVMGVAREILSKVDEIPVR